MPSFKIRPKALSRHGRQHVVDYQGAQVFFSVGNKSRLSTMSVRHNMEVRGGGGDEGEAGGQAAAAWGARIGRIWRTRSRRPVLLPNAAVLCWVQVCQGEGSEVVYEIEADLAGRTLQFKVALCPAAASAPAHRSPSSMQMACSFCCSHRQSSNSCSPVALVPRRTPRASWWLWRRSPPRR